MKTLLSKQGKRGERPVWVGSSPVVFPRSYALAIAFSALMRRIQVVCEVAVLVDWSGCGMSGDGALSAVSDPVIG